MRSKKTEQPQDNRNTELYEALRKMEKERGIPVDFMLGQIKKAIATACKSNYGGNEDVLINMNPEEGVFDVYLNKVVVEDMVTDTNKEIDVLPYRPPEALSVREFMTVKRDRCWRNIRVN